MFTKIEATHFLPSQEAELAYQFLDSNLIYQGDPWDFPSTACRGKQRTYKQNCPHGFKCILQIQFILLYYHYFTTNTIQWLSLKN